MRRYHPRDPYEPPRRRWSHPVRSLFYTALLVYAGWAFRGCAESPESLARRLSRSVEENPVQYERLVDRASEGLQSLKARAHRRHAAWKGFVHPKDVRLVWAEEQGKDYAVVRLRNGHGYSIRQEGLGEVFVPVSKLEKTVEGSR